MLKCKLINNFIDGINYIRSVIISLLSSDKREHAKEPDIVKPTNAKRNEIEKAAIYLIYLIRNKKNYIKKKKSA